MGRQERLEPSLEVGSAGRVLGESVGVDKLLGLKRTGERWRFD